MATKKTTIELFCAVLVCSKADPAIFVRQTKKECFIAMMDRIDQEKGESEVYWPKRPPDNAPFDAFRDYLNEVGQMVNVYGLDPVETNVKVEFAAT